MDHSEAGVGRIPEVYLGQGPYARVMREVSTQEDVIGPARALLACAADYIERLENTVERLRRRTKEIQEAEMAKRAGLESSNAEYRRLFPAARESLMKRADGTINYGSAWENGLAAEYMRLDAENKRLITRSLEAVNEVDEMRRITARWIRSGMHLPGCTDFTLPRTRQPWCNCGLSYAMYQYERIYPNWKEDQGGGERVDNG